MKFRTYWKDEKGISDGELKLSHMMLLPYVVSSFALNVEEC
jgi:hypothetical protein